MTIAILHLTDIHIKQAEDAILARGEMVAKSVRRHLHEVSKVVILLSGDIAQAGLKKEYELAESFLRSIKENIETEFLGKEIVFVIAPGNHDCDFSEVDDLRDLVLKSIEDKYPELPKKFIDLCTGCQASFEDFRERMSSGVAKASEDKLWLTFEVAPEKWSS